MLCVLLSAPFVLRLWAVSRGLWALSGTPAAGIMLYRRLRRLALRAALDISLYLSSRAGAQDLSRNV